MPDVRARTAGPADIAALIALDPAADTDPNRQRFIRRSINANECYIVERDLVIIAFGVLNYSFFDHGFVASITVSESVRYSDSVIALLRYMESRCRTAKLFATAGSANVPLQNILRKIQYEESGHVMNVAADDSTEMIFYKYLEPDDSKVPEHHFGLG